MKELKTHSNPDAKVFLIGTKKDLESKREVSEFEAKTFIKENGIINFIECSSKEGFNSQKIFVEAAKALYEDYILINRPRGDSILPHRFSLQKQKFDKNVEKNKINTKKGCC